MLAEIVFAAGCFWGVEKHFENIPGVVEAKSGYAGGNYENPDYDTVLRYRYVKNDPDEIVNHTESVLVEFDPQKVKAGKLIRSFWELHDPTQKNRQGNDVGNNYRSAIFYTTEKQRDIALQTKATYQTLLSEKGYGEIVTEIKPLQKFWPAEGYHQDYLAKNPNGYCPNHSTGVTFTNSEEKSDAAQPLTPLGGKEIIVVDAEGFCPYCERFKKEVLSGYDGTVPLRTATAKRLKGFEITSKLDATPTILFIQEGKEIFGHRGYMDKKQFYKTLGAFKLGKESESYDVAFNKGTDSRFCKQYDKFKNTGDGVFIDKLSGDILFDTKERFNSGTGWLSFYKAVEGATVEREDNSYGMRRTEVLAKKSGIHLGHVFDEGDHRRFCINATVLEFVPREELKAR